MKILFVDLQYEYGMQDRGRNCIGESFMKSITALGHSVEAFYYDDYLSPEKHSELQKALLTKATQIKPDLIYFILFENQFDTETIEQLSKGAITVNWFGDDQWRFESFTRKYAPFFTWCITTDPFALQKYKNIGINNVFLSQWAAIDTVVDEEKEIEFEYDVSFVGSSHSIRRWMVDELMKRGIKVNTFGYGWKEGPVSPDRMHQIFKRSKINLNLGNSIVYDIRYLTHNLKNPIVALKDKKNVAQVKARNFEIPYHGGFQLTDFVPKLDLYFDIGKEISCFSNVDEAAQLIKYYLFNTHERESVRAAGMLRARAEHGYAARQKKFFEHIQC